MKREDVLAILDNQELDNDARVTQILNMRGDEIKGKNDRIRELEGLVSQKDTDIATFTEKYKDYDAILQERDTLVAEKAENAFQDRFNAVLGANKPKNTFTRDGLVNAFRTEIAKEENAEKPDADIFKTIIDGHEAEYFEGKVTVNMTPINPDVTPPTETQAYLDKMYAGNPYYKPN